MRTRSIAARVAWVALEFAIAACNGGPATTLSISHTLESRVVTIGGSTNLPDGAFIDIRLIQQEAFDAAASDGGANTSPLVVDRFARVSGGTYAASVDLSSWPAGAVELLGIFKIDSSQPSPVVAAYGQNGERLNGPALVNSASDGRYLEVSEQFELE